MRVLHVHKIAGVGGSERHLLTLLPSLRDHGVDARFLGLDVPRSDADRFYAELAERGVPSSRVRCTLDVDPRLLRGVVRATRASRPDLLHTHLVHGDVYGALASYAVRRPAVSSRHNDDRYLLGPFRYVDRMFARRSRRVIAISDAVRRHLVLAGIPPAKLVTVHYGLDDLPDAPSERTPADLGIESDAPLVLAIGRLTAQKDHATLLHAFARVASRHPRARLAILGIGPLEGQIRLLVDRLGLTDAVLLPGRLEIRDWLERADVFVHTSRWEGFGMVLLEAMLAGLPVVATRVSAVPEVVEDGVTGQLVDAGDRQGVAVALERYLDDPEQARTHGDEGGVRARERFSVERMTVRTIEVYDAALCDG